jgi:FkbM family methyltransferase
MAFNNVGSILRIGSPSSSLKLLLITASITRPKYRPLCMKLLEPFTDDGEVLLRYRCHGHELQTYVRLRETSSDLRSVFDLTIRDTYDLDLNFRPDLVIDGGANIGLFTLRTAAALASTGLSSVRFIACEPLPQNVEQLQRHLALNGISAEVLAGCLGGAHGSIPFYCREAICSSFDGAKPYSSVIDIPVYTLKEAIGSASAERILIKLDIEGMEMEVLKAFIPSEQRAVYLVGELHEYARNASDFERMFRENGWVFQYREICDNHATFRACSPQAFPMIPSMANAAASPLPA